MNSFSVYIDNKKNKKSIDIDTVLSNIYPKYIEKWVDSNIIFNCQTCSVKFGYFTKKHHCRACGCVFCDNCCKQYISIPNFIKKPIPETSYKHQIMSLYRNTKDDLVCGVCYSKIVNLKNISYILKIAEFLDLETLQVILAVNKNWHNAGIHSLSKFRNIQYRENNKLYDCSWEKNIILNSKKLYNHPNWKIHIIKIQLQMFFENKIKDFSYTYNDESLKNQTECWTFMCSRKCNLNNDIFDFIEILNFVNILNSKIRNIFWKEKKIMEFIVKIACEFMGNTKNKNTIKNLVPLFVLSLSHLLNECITEINFFFIFKIIEVVIIGTGNILSLYDEITYKMSLSEKSMGIINLSDIVKKYFDNNIETKTKTEIKKTKETFILTKNMEEIKLPILYPFDYSWKIIKINEITVMKSNSKPILFDVIIENETKKKTKKVKFLVKNEQTLRKEQLISNLIYLLMQKFKQQEMSMSNNFENIPTYEIKMLNKNIGVIEFVEDSITLRQINDNGYTIQNYIADNNNGELMDVIKMRYMTSLSNCCCLSYILGLGDRHLDNIMINKKGQIFNIDYGYLLENPITNILGAPNIKITNDMIDFLGGTNGKYYKLFKLNLVHTYDVMRLYKNIIISHYEMIGDEKHIDWKYYGEKLENRFMKGLCSNDIEVTLVNEIESSSSLSNSFNDTCHYLSMWWNKKS